MKFIKTTLLIAITILLNSGCYASMSGTVIDAETGKPIEGAVILVEWTYTSGKWIGLRTTSSYKVVEVITDKEGKFKVSGVVNPFVNTPEVTIYKKGYVCWSSRIIFPDYRNRTDFIWGKTYTFKLEHFKPEYSYIEHTSFIGSAINSGLGEKKLMEDAYYWEELEASKERDKRRRK